MKGSNYIRKPGRGRFLEQIVCTNDVKNVRCLYCRMKGQKGVKSSAAADNH